MNAQDKQHLEALRRKYATLRTNVRLIANLPDSDEPYNGTAIAMARAALQESGESVDSLVQSARIVVRETGELAQSVETGLFDCPSGIPKCQAIRAYMGRSILHAYDMTCAHLTQLDPAGAPEFIRSTYGLAFRQTEVTR